MIDLIKKLKEYHRLREFIFMMILSFMCFSFSVFRVFYVDSKMYLFLNWNLFLAILPWVFSGAIIIFNLDLRRNKFLVPALLFLWILFFPNTFYILTDLFHLKLNSSMPIWFDLTLVLSFAWTGLLFGVLSLADVEKVLRKSLGNLTFFAISFLLFLTSFGIYIGRYLRWNSWDIIQDPIFLVYDIGSRFINPFVHPRTWGMTIFMGVLLNMIYWSFKFFLKRR